MRIVVVHTNTIGGTSVGVAPLIRPIAPNRTQVGGANWIVIQVVRGSLRGHADG